MTELDLTPLQVESALRQCAYSDECYGCPYTDERGIPRDNCMRELMADAASTIDALQCESK